MRFLSFIALILCMFFLLSFTVSGMDGLSLVESKVLSPDELYFIFGIIQLDGGERSSIPLSIGQNTDMEVGDLVILSSSLVDDVDGVLSYDSTISPIGGYNKLTAVEFLFSELDIEIDGQQYSYSENLLVISEELHTILDQSLFSTFHNLNNISVFETISAPFLYILDDTVVCIIISDSFPKISFLNVPNSSRSFLTLEANNQTISILNPSNLLSETLSLGENNFIVKYDGSEILSFNKLIFPGLNINLDFSDYVFPEKSSIPTEDVGYFTQSDVYIEEKLSTFSIIPLTPLTVSLIALVVLLPVYFFFRCKHKKEKNNLNLSPSISGKTPFRIKDLSSNENEFFNKYINSLDKEVSDHLEYLSAPSSQDRKTTKARRILDLAYSNNFIEKLELHESARIKLDDLYDISDSDCKNAIDTLISFYSYRKNPSLIYSKEYFFQVSSYQHKYPLACELLNNDDFYGKRYSVSSGKIGPKGIQFYEFWLKSGSPRYDFGKNFPVFEVKNLQTSRKKIKNPPLPVSFEVKPGEMFCITGSSGSGKTILLDILSGYDTKYKGSFLSSCNNSNYCIGYVPQKNVFYRNILPRKMLHYYCKIFNLFKTIREADNKISELSDELKLDSNILDCSVSDLSGGELKLLSILFHLLKSPDILLLDEPDSGLDSINRNIIYDLLYSINKNNKVTVIFSTHHDYILNDINSESVSIYDNTQSISRDRIRLYKIINRLECPIKKS